MIARQFGPELVRSRGPKLGVRQRIVLTALAACRTAALGGHVDECAGCGLRRPSYNSCRDRHCPTCLGSAQRDWLEARRRDLLPIPYFHVVFTLPAPLAALAAAHPGPLYELLFQAASAALREAAADPRRLGGRIGVLAVLHTWGQNLHLHPHLHCVVTGGGLSADGRRWSPGRPRYLFPVRVLSALFRGKFLAGLRALRARSELPLTGEWAKWERPERFAACLRRLYARAWVVYAKPPFGGPEQVLKYLARYTHRVAISNRRILDVSDGRVTFSWKDYADGDQVKRMRLSGGEFLRRFLQHVLPQGFVRIRYYGLLANRGRDGLLARCRRLSGASTPDERPAAAAPPPAERAESPRACPNCRQRTWSPVESTPRPSLRRLASTSWNWDTS